MKLLRFSVYLLLTITSVFFLTGCAVDEPDYREQDYGYVQFKLYKEASYPTTKAIGNDPLEFLSDATKIKVTLGYGGDLIYQTLTFSYSDAASAEFGIRSEKLKLLAGEYTLLSFVLFGKEDQEMYEERHPSGKFVITPGGLIVHDVLADTRERGFASFTLVKDFVPGTKAVGSADGSNYTFDEIGYITLKLYNNTAKENVDLKFAPATFSIHFDETDDKEDYQVSTIKCDTLLTLLAGNYTLKEYTTYNKSKKQLEFNNSPSSCEFDVYDNRETKVKVPITLREDAPYIKDYLVLKDIWQALDGENWYYIGENFNTGTNWDFNKDVDLWGDQPGVQLYTANAMTDRKGKAGKDYGFRSAFCLETQHYPDSVHHPQWPSCILREDEAFHSFTSYTFS